MASYQGKEKRQSEDSISTLSMISICGALLVCAYLSDANEPTAFSISESMSLIRGQLVDAHALNISHTSLDKATEKNFIPPEAAVHSRVLTTPYPSSPDAPKELPGHHWHEERGQLGLARGRPGPGWGKNWGNHHQTAVTDFGITHFTEHM